MISHFCQYGRGTSLRGKIKLKYKKFAAKNAEATGVSLRQKRTEAPDCARMKKIKLPVQSAIKKRIKLKIRLTSSFFPLENMYSPKPEVTASVKSKMKLFTNKRKGIN